MADSQLIERAFIVPGQPHILLAPEKSPGWASLKASYEAIAREIERSKAELILLYSTQWFSVIGHLFQTDPRPKWLLVDQNWYEYGEIPYEFAIDSEFGELYCATAKKNGLTASAVNYHGFPIDTGTVVALKLLNPENRIPASVVSCNIYSERDETRLLGRSAREAIERYGKRTIVVCVTNLSNRYEVTEIDPANDRVSSAKDDEWNRKLLEMLGEGRLEDVAQVAREFGREANADMGFKAVWWLAALMGEHNRYDGKVWDYQPVWGTGAALVELTPSEKMLDFEKEFDEAPAGATGGAADAAGGLESHNKLPGGGTAAAPTVEPHLDHRFDAAGAPSGTALKLVTEPESSGRIVSERAPSPVGAYPHARKVGNLLYLSGIGPRQPGSNEIPGLVRNSANEVTDYDIEVQTRAVIANLQTILEDAGSSLDKIVDITVFLTDMKRDFAIFNRVYAELLGGIQPTRTTIGVDSLPTPISIEMKAIAEQ
ncbi:MAG TPA: Rid family hydrolase [Thermoanaerobaculia bacterium]|nr:Rid family hydrolase [Thermoanaerobaculia bacterium]